uniref:ATR-interacting protein n=1 Tax=Ciona savignyi TaxID=51511 RepID=H2YP75_CIOSA
MAFAVTKNPKTLNKKKFKPINMKQLSREFELPASKRPRVGFSSADQTKGTKFNDYGVNSTTGIEFDDDFTGAELEELEVLASQVESKNLTCTSMSKPKLPDTKQNSASGSFKFKQLSNLHKRTVTSSGPTLPVKDLSISPSKQLKEQEKKIKDLETLNNQKCGEARLLRDKLKNVEKLMNKELQAKLTNESMMKDEVTKLEADMSKKMEVLRDQIKFKDAELKEAENMIQNLTFRNKMLLQESKEQTSNKNPFVQQSFANGNWSCSKTDESAKKIIRLVKPESPRVTSNIKRFKHNDQYAAVEPSVKPITPHRKKAQLGSKIINTVQTVPNFIGGISSETLMMFLHYCSKFTGYSPGPRTNHSNVATGSEPQQQLLLDAIDATS